VSLGAAAVCTGLAGRTSAAAPVSGVSVRFVGMMGFIERTDRSFLVATPGPEAQGHFSHRPFLMARSGSPIAGALEMTQAPNVVPGAFDARLADSHPAGFVYRCLDHTSIDIVAGADPSVANHADQMARMSRIAPGKRVRGNVEKWASASVSLRGGRLDNAAAHPDAGRLWTFGSHRQRLTDAVNYEASVATIRLTSGNEARTFVALPDQPTELWVISASIPHGGPTDPRRIEHSHVAFEYLVGARTVMAECAEATGRAVPSTELPCIHPSSAGLGHVAAEARIPPWSELCFLIAILNGR
jgi:hypothetical protein